VLTQIENELRAVAEANPQFALELADILWDEGALETRLLAAFCWGESRRRRNACCPASPRGLSKSATPMYARHCFPPA